MNYPESSFMKTLGEKGFAFSSFLNLDYEREFIIPHSLLKEDSFEQSECDFQIYKLQGIKYIKYNE